MDELEDRVERVYLVEALGPLGLGLRKLVVRFRKHVVELVGFSGELNRKKWCFVVEVGREKGKWSSFVCFECEEVRSRED